MEIYLREENFADQTVFLSEEIFEYFIHKKIRKICEPKNFMEINNDLLEVHNATQNCDKLLLYLYMHVLATAYLMYVQNQI